MAKQNEQKQDKPVYVATVRTALSGPEDGIMRKLPESYDVVNSDVRDVLNYLTDKKQIKQDEAPTARSLESEMKKEYTVAVNGRTVRLTDKVAPLFQPKTHRDVTYQNLEMEIASVQEGGLIYKIR